MLDTLLDELNTSIEKRGGESIQLPKDISSFNGIRGNSFIRNWLWKVPGFRRWRVTNLNAGLNLQVLNSVAYPEYANDQPILGVDLLWFGHKQKLVAVLDFQPLVQDEEYFSRHYQGLMSLNKKYHALTNNENMRSFDPNQYFAPWLLFCRGGFKQANNSLPEAFREFIDCYWELNAQLLKSPSLLTPEKVRVLQINYDIYSAERDPAHGLFSSYFGKAWTDEFVKTFLFPDSNYSGLGVASEMELEG